MIGIQANEKNREEQAMQGAVALTKNKGDSFGGVTKENECRQHTKHSGGLPLPVTILKGSRNQE